MKAALKHVSIVTFATVAVLGAGVGFIGVSTLLSRGAERIEGAFADSVEEEGSLDPNDCSRPIDESNQETCDPVVDQ